jgi:hypothetical protein
LTLWRIKSARFSISRRYLKQTNAKLNPEIAGSGAAVTSVSGRNFRVV